MLSLISVYCRVQGIQLLHSGKPGSNSKPASPIPSYKSPNTASRPSPKTHSSPTPVPRHEPHTTNHTESTPVGDLLGIAEVAN